MLSCPENERGTHCFVVWCSSGLVREGGEPETDGSTPGSRRMLAGGLCVPGTADIGVCWEGAGRKAPTRVEEQATSSISRPPGDSNLYVCISACA